MKVIIGKIFEVIHADPRQYREPFFGGRGVGLSLLDHPNVSGVWINDRDPGIAALWTSIAQYPVQLIDHIVAFQPSADAFYSFKQSLLTLKAMPDDPDGIVEVAFRKTATHQLSYSGLGTMSGGPLGGRSQRSKYRIDSRWSPQRLCKRISEVHERFIAANITGCTCLDFSELIAAEGDCLIYLDPPYVVQGNCLYQCGFSDWDHVRLAACLHKTHQPWVLSYDNCPLIRDLYSWADIQEVNVKYSVSSARITSELLISSKVEPVILPIAKPKKPTSVPVAS